MTVVLFLTLNGQFNVSVISKPDSIRHSTILEVMMRCLKLKYSVLYAMYMYLLHYSLCFCCI